LLEFKTSMIRPNRNALHTKAHTFIVVTKKSPE